MSPFLVLIAASTLGVEVGWQPLVDGGHEYTIQLEPQLVDRMKHDDLEISSEVPPQLDVRRYRIIVGTAKLPREVGAAPTARALPAAPKNPPRDKAPQRAAEPTPAPIAKSDPPPVEEFTPAEPAAPTETEVPPNDALTIEEKPSETPPEPARNPPAKLPDESNSQPVNQPAGWHSDSEHQAEKPKLDSDAAAKLTEPARPWTAFVIATLLLCCSLGANLYLGWTVVDGRRRYREALAKVRPLAAS